MIFEPEPGTSIDLRGEKIEFVSLESNGPASVFVYAESGREGTVYKVLKGGKYYALKVFYPEYRDKRLQENTEKLSRFKRLEGFRVAERTLFTNESFPDVVAQYPDLNFAVMMPWVEGTLWGNLIMQSDLTLQPEKYFTIAQSLIRAISNLEYQGAAHCDLSNNNFIIDHSYTAVQLIDIEDMYAPDMPRPIPDVSYGTIGYRTKWIAQNGLWGPDSDRFASAILCSELITWHNQEIRENKAGDSSFFDEGEIGEESQRYKLMSNYLGDLGGELKFLFDRAWLAQDPSECPSAFDWMNALEKLGRLEKPQQKDFLADQTLIHFRTSLGKHKRPNKPMPEPEINIEIPQKSPKIELQEGSTSVQATSEVKVDLKTKPESLEYPISGTDNESQTSQEPQINIQEERPAVFHSEAEIEINSVNTSEGINEPMQEIEAGPQTNQPVQEENLQENGISDITDATIISRGVPPKIVIDLEILDFGTLGESQNSLQIHISNLGGSILKGSIRSEKWIDVSPTDFVLPPGGEQSITVSINTNYPKPQNGLEYRTANALTIESNAGGEVIGAIYKLEKPSFYKSVLVRVLAGGALGFISIMCLCILIAAIYFYLTNR